MEVTAPEEVKHRCLQALTGIGVQSELCQFYADVMQCEYDMTHCTYRLQKELVVQFERSTPECAALFAIMQSLTKKFYHWKCCIAALSEQGRNIPPLKFNTDKLTQANMLKALCSLETNEINMHEGDDLIVTDITCPNQLKVRNPRGEEGYVPALSCILPTPDGNASSAVERLQIHLLTSWTECVRRVKSLFFEHINSICQYLQNSWNNSRELRAVQLRDRDRVRRRFQRLFDAAVVQQQGLDLSRLHAALYSLEKELASLPYSYADLATITQNVANVDKAVLCCQNFHRQYRSYRETLKDAPRPIHVVQRLEHLRQMAHGKNFKYYEMKLTLDDVEVTEETSYIPSKIPSKSPRTSSSSSTPGSQQRRRLFSAESKEEHVQTAQVEESSHVLPGGVTAKHHTVTAEQFTTSEQEEQQKIVVKAVVDPRPQADSEETSRKLTMEQAVAAGILIPTRGVYRNPVTGEETPIAAAMSSGLIEIDYVMTRRSAETTRAIGLITIQTMIDHREFTITSAIDSLTAEKIDADEARRRGIIVETGSESDDGGGYYVVEATGEQMPLLVAIDSGWVFVNYEEPPEGVEPEVEVHTYAVTDVWDPLLSCEVSFADAVRRGIIDRDTGDYVDRQTRRPIPVADAITQGLLKARLVKDVDKEFGLKVDRRNAVVVQRIDKIRRHVLKGALKAVSAFKSVAATKQTANGTGERQQADDATTKT